MAHPPSHLEPDSDPASEAAYQAALVKYGSDQVARPCDYETLFLDASRGVASHDLEGLRAVARYVRPLPKTIAEAWDEWSYIDRRDRVKREFFLTRGVCPAMRERAAMLAEAVLSGLPAADLEDLEYRAKLFAVLAAEGAAGRDRRPDLTAAQQQAFAETLLADLGRLKAVLRPGEPQGGADQPQTATERRAAVVARLCDPETSKWSDRAIAKACGVSPQTVSNWRHKLADLGEPDGPEDRERYYRRRGTVHRMKIKAIGVVPRKGGSAL
ncbi:MAG: helix-turn-helix domain-containing protein [Kiloniellales bacterium]